MFTTQEQARQAADRVATWETELAFVIGTRCMGDALVPINSHVWASSQFVVEVTEERGTTRIAVQRTGDSIFIRPEHRSGKPISWEDLQAVKSAIGFGDCWAVEVYPPDSDAVNVSNIRHLWLVPPPDFAWKRSEGEAFFRKE